MYIGGPHPLPGTNHNIPMSLYASSVPNNQLKRPLVPKQSDNHQQMHFSMNPFQPCPQPHGHTMLLYLILQTPLE